MNREDRFKMLFEHHPRPWKIVCQYVAGDYMPTHVLDDNGDKVIEAGWGSGLESGKITYACITEMINNSIWDDFSGN